MINQENRPSYVRYEMRAEEDREASIKNGFYTEKDVPFAIVTPAGGNLIVERRADDFLKDWEKRAYNDSRMAPIYDYYRKGFDEFMKGNAIPENGVPLKTWPVISPSHLNACLSLQIRTVEDLASASETAIQKIGMGGRALCEKAKEWLQTAKGTGKVVEQIAAMKVELEQLREQNKKYAELIEELKPRRGRPPKSSLEDGENMAS